MSVICWYWDVSLLADPGLFSKGMSALPWAERREKVMRFRYEKDRRLCLGAGLLAAWALRRAGADNLSMTMGKYGKPGLKMHPGIHFNLSHGGNLVVCAVSDVPVGIDVETGHRYDPGVTARCFQPDEIALIKNAPDPDKAFTRMWVRKESLLKRMGTGLSCPPASVSVLPGKAAKDGSAFSEWERQGHMICVCYQPDPADCSPSLSKALISI